MFSADISARRHVARVPRCGVFFFLVIQNETGHASEPCVRRWRVRLHEFPCFFLMLVHIFYLFSLHSLLLLPFLLFRLTLPRSLYFSSLLSSSSVTLSLYFFPFSFSSSLLSSFLSFSPLTFPLPLQPSLPYSIFFPSKQHDSRSADHRRSDNPGDAESPARRGPRAISGTPTI